MKGREDYLADRGLQAPMEEMMGHFGGSAPTERILRLYRHWAKSQWGIIITGNVCVDSTHLGLPFDMALPEPPFLKNEDLVKRFKAYAKVCKGIDGESSTSTGNKPLAIVQLVHAGRQSLRGSGRAPWKPSLAPSSIPMKTAKDLGVVGKPLDWLLWGVPSAMTVDQIHWLIQRFADASQLMAAAGFDGVELHASHGYQLAAFLSPRTNTRTDAYGGSSRNRARLLLEMVEAVRAKVPRDFAVGVKLNSSDYIQGGLTEEDALENVKWLAETGMCDFVEVSGGNYENPSFLTDGFDADAETAKLKGQKQEQASIENKASVKVSDRTRKREALFATFAKRARGVLPQGSGMKIIVTGGLRTRGGMASALETGAIDGVGIGRPACVHPDLPDYILNASVADSDEAHASPPAYTVPGAGVLGLLPIKILGAGWQTLWHNGMLAYLGQDEAAKPDTSAGPLRVLLAIFVPSLFATRSGPGAAGVFAVLGSLVAAAVGSVMFLVMK